MDTEQQAQDLPGTLHRLIAAALEADISPSRIEDLIRLEQRPEPGRCPECESTMRSDGRLTLRCTNCGITTAIEPRS